MNITPVGIDIAKTVFQVHYVLLLSGLLEVVWPVGLKKSDALLVCR